MCSSQSSLMQARANFLLILIALMILNAIVENDNFYMAGDIQR